MRRDLVITVYRFVVYLEFQRVTRSQVVDTGAGHYFFEPAFEGTFILKLAEMGKYFQKPVMYPLFGILAGGGIADRYFH